MCARLPVCRKSQEGARLAPRVTFAGQLSGKQRASFAVGRSALLARIDLFHRTEPAIRSSNGLGSCGGEKKGAVFCPFEPEDEQQKERTGRANWLGLAGFLGATATARDGRSADRHSSHTVPLAYCARATKSRPFATDYGRKLSCFAGLKLATEVFPITFLSVAPAGCSWLARPRASEGFFVFWTKLRAEP